MGCASRGCGWSGTTRRRRRAVADPAERTRSRSISSGSGMGGSAIRTSGPSTGATSRMARSASTTSRAPRTMASCSRGTDGSPVTASDARWSRSSLAARLASSSRSAANDRKIQTENGIAHRERTAVTRTCSPTSVNSSSASTIKRMASMQTMNSVGKRIASTRRVRNCGAALVRRAYANQPDNPDQSERGDGDERQRRGGGAGRSGEDGAAGEQREPEPQADPSEADPAPSFVDPSGIRGCSLVTGRRGATLHTSMVVRGPRGHRPRYQAPRSVIRSSNRPAR